MNQTKETLEGLKSLFKNNKVEYSNEEEYQKEQATLSTAIGWGEVLEQAEGVLPEKLEATGKEGVGYVRGHNDMIYIIQPILAKAKLRIKELERGILKSEYQVLVTRREWDALENMDEELQSAKLRIAELEMNLKELEKK